MNEAINKLAETHHNKCSNEIAIQSPSYSSAELTADVAVKFAKYLQSIESEYKSFDFHFTEFITKHYKP